jgi:hypothetical protein
MKDYYGKNFHEMSKDAQETAKGMIEFCINNGYCMGMDEGWTKHDRKRAFRKQLEEFSGMTADKAND